MALHPRQYVFGFEGLHRVLIVAELVVNAPDIIGLAVHQNGRARVRGGQTKPAA